MTDTRSFTRDVRGRFAKIDVERDVIAPGLGTPDAFAYDLQPRRAPEADDLAQGGQQRRLEPRTAVLVADDAEVRARTRYGVQGSLGRLAARRHADPMDPTVFLTGAE